MKRFDFDVNCYMGAKVYFKNRAKQLLLDGIKMKTMTDLGWGVLVEFDVHLGTYISIYVYSDYRGQGKYKEHLQSMEDDVWGVTVLTTEDCKITDYLVANAIPHYVVGAFTQTPEYKAIEHYYGDKKANRSRQFLMNHIDEGLVILKDIGASKAAMKAYCLHPLFQSDETLTELYRKGLLYNVDKESLILAMEYRSVANEYLSTREINSIDEIRISPLKDVNDMLIADKIQNSKDFVKYHKGTHPRSAELDLYFQNWFDRLGITEETYDRMVNKLRFNVEEVALVKEE